MNAKTVTRKKPFPAIKIFSVLGVKLIINEGSMLYTTYYMNIFQIRILELGAYSIRSAYFKEVFL